MGFLNRSIIHFVNNIYKKKKGPKKKNYGGGGYFLPGEFLTALNRRVSNRW
jgi:hypothetical protein